MYEENNVIDLDKFNLNRKSLIKSMADNMEYSSVEHPQIGILLVPVENRHSVTG